MRSLKDYEPITQTGRIRPGPSTEGNDFRWEAFKVVVVGTVLTLLLVWIG